MPTLATAYNDWSRACYKIRVRESKTTYLWGSAGITKDITFSKQQLLHIRNELFGGPVTFGTQVASGAKTTIGTLQPGECVSIPMEGIAGVFATCEGETTICCLIRE